MEARAILRNVPTSPRKMRLVVDLIRGQKVSKALAILKHQPQSAAPVLHKVLLSAVANWQQKNEDIKLEDSDLYVKSAFVDGGKMLKRLRPAPQGRAHRIRKRSNHITIVIDDESQSLINELSSIESKENQ
jgi:large subunit ribosomal protein L22